MTENQEPAGRATMWELIPEQDTNGYETGRWLVARRVGLHAETKAIFYVKEDGNEYLALSAKAELAAALNEKLRAPGGPDEQYMACYEFMQGWDALAGKEDAGMRYWLDTPPPFVPSPCPPSCNRPNDGHHWHERKRDNKFTDYWNGLTEEQREYLRDKSRRYQQSLSMSALEQRAEHAEVERDLALAHDTQPYPTAAAYEAVCKARDKWQARAEALEAALGRIREFVEVQPRKSETLRVIAKIAGEHERTSSRAQ